MLRCLYWYQLQKLYFTLLSPPFFCLTNLILQQKISSSSIKSQVTSFRDYFLFFFIYSMHSKCKWSSVSGSGEYRAQLKKATKTSVVIHWDWLIHIKVISPSTAVSVMYLPRITKRDKLFFICWSTAVGVPKCEQPKLKPAAYFMSVFLEFHELHFVSHE